MRVIKSYEIAPLLARLVIISLYQHFFFSYFPFIVPLVFSAQNARSFKPWRFSKFKIKFINKKVLQFFHHWVLRKRDLIVNKNIRILKTIFIKKECSWEYFGTKNIMKKIFLNNKSFLALKFCFLFSILKRWQCQKLLC